VIEKRRGEERELQIWTNLFELLCVQRERSRGLNVRGRVCVCVGVLFTNHSR
jgi:hypothetical protein